MQRFKFYVRLRRAWRICIRDTVYPIFDKAAALQILPLPISIFLSFILGEKISTSVNFDLLEKAAMAFLITVPVWFLINLICCPFRAIAEETSEGTWSKTIFIYNKPKLLLTAFVTDQNNNVPIPFIINDIIAGGSIEIRIEKDGMDIDVKTIISDIDATYPINWFGITSSHNYILTWAPKSKRLNLFTHKENQNPSIIRVYLLSFNAK